MAEQLRFHPLVAEDLKAAVGWCDDISQEYLFSRTCCYSNT
jgi:hypothetical protein